VVAVAVAALTACDDDQSAERPAGPVLPDPPSQTVEPSADSSASPVVAHRAAMPEVPLRYLYARGAGAEGVLVSAAGVTETGQRATAYVPTRAGAVFASGGRVYELADGGPARAIGRVPEHQVFLQVDPTLRYVAWEVRRSDGRHARVFVHDTVAHRLVLDRVLLWRDPDGPLRTAGFGADRLRLVHLPRWDFWTFATVSGRTVVTPGGQVADLRSRRVTGPTVSRGVWSPGLRYRAAEARGRHPWRVVDLASGRDVTPAALLGPTLRAAQFSGWLGNATFGVLASSGTWRDVSVVASVCRVAGRCRVVWRLHRGVEDNGLQASTEID